MDTTPLLQPSPNSSIICQICQQEIKKKDNYRKNADLSGKIRELALEWKNLKIPEHDRFADFPNVYNRICVLSKGSFHESCHLDLGTKLRN